MKASTGYGAIGADDESYGGGDIEGGGWFTGFVYDPASGMNGIWLSSLSIFSYSNSSKEEYIDLYTDQGQNTATHVTLFVMLYCIDCIHDES